MTVDIGQSSLETIVVKGQALMIQTHQVKDGRIEVVNGSLSGNRLEPELVALPVTESFLHPSTGKKAGKGILRSVIGLLTYQRTIRVVRPDPKHCMYNIRNWEAAKALLNEKHKEHSQSNLLKDLKDTIVASGEEK